MGLNEKGKKETKVHGFLAIIPRARMGSDLMAHEAEDRMDYWLKAHSGERNNCF